MLNTTKKCVSELNKLSRGFYTGNYVGTFVLSSVCVGLFTAVCGTIVFDIFLVAKDEKITLGVRKPSLGEQSGRPESNLLFGVFGFFQKEALLAADVVIGIKHEAKEAYNEIKTTSPELKAS